MRALNGLKVIDFSRYIAGPYCCQLLGDMGADVIKVETPKGDIVRDFMPAVDNMSYYFMAHNRNKRSIAVNTRKEEGKEILRKLISTADVLVQNFKPGTMEAMGFSWETMHELNPRLIYVAISGYGQTGPMASFPAYDKILQAMSGLMHMTGDPDGMPYAAGTFVVDYLTAAHSAIAVLGAVIAREKTGKGQMIDASLLQSAAALLIDSAPATLLLGETRTRVGNSDLNCAPSDCYKTKDNGYAFVAVTTNEHWNTLLQVMGRTDLIGDPRFGSIKDRYQNRKEIDEIVASWAIQHNRDEIVSALNENGLPSAPILNHAEFLNLPQIAHSKILVDLPLSNGMKVPVQSLAFTFSDDPFEVRFSPPVLGGQTDEILTALGYSPEQIEIMHKAGTV
ncbi:MAG: CaiB/BaiF CoA transferase family protein [Christensenellales bacterium]